MTVQLEPNQGKKKEVVFDNTTYLRFPVKTKVINEGDNILEYWIRKREVF